MATPRRLVTAMLCACVTASAARAQERLTLDDAIRRAAGANPHAVAADAQVAGAAARAQQARSGFLPRVDLTESWQRGDQPVFVFSSLLMQRRFTAADFALDALNHPDPITNYHAAITLEQPLYDGGRTRMESRAAELQRDRTEAERQRTLAAVRLDTVRAYARVIAASADAATAASSQAAIAEDYARVKRRQDAGLETDASVLAVQVARDEAEVARIRAAGDEEIARAQLNAVIGAPLDSRFELMPLTGADATLPDIGVAEEDALKNRPEARAASAALSSAQVALEGAHQALLPSIAAMGSFEGNGPSFTDRASAWGVGLQVRWNVFAGGGDAARIHAAAAAVTSAEADRRAAETALRLDARTAVVLARAVIAAERASRLAVDQAHESHRIVRNRYDAGLATANDLLRAAETVTRAESNRTKALVDAQVALAELERALGREIHQ